MSIRDALSYEWQTFAEVQSLLLKRCGVAMPEFQIRKAVSAFPDVLVNGNKCRLQAKV